MRSARRVISFFEIFSCIADSAGRDYTISDQGGPSGYDAGFSAVNTTAELVLERISIWQNPYIKQAEYEHQLYAVTFTIQMADTTVGVNQKRFHEHWLPGSLLDVAMGHRVDLEHVHAGSAPVRPVMRS